MIFSVIWQSKLKVKDKRIWIHNKLKNASRHPSWINKVLMINLYKKLSATVQVAVEAGRVLAELREKWALTLKKVIKAMKAWNNPNKEKKLIKILWQGR